MKAGPHCSESLVVSGLMCSLQFPEASLARAALVLEDNTKIPQGARASRKPAVLMVHQTIYPATTEVGGKSTGLHYPQSSGNKHSLS